MSTALVSRFVDLDDVLAKNSYKMHMKVTERKSVPSSLSNGTATAIRRTSSVSISSSQCSPHKLNMLSLMDSNHRKLDRSLSEPVDRSNNANNNNNNNNNNQQQQQQRAVQQQANSSRYKTELCRPFEESGKCKYGDKCQFAHGSHELRTLARHPKYKTELCRTFHTIGFCPYGPRCHFIHNADASPSGSPTTPSPNPSTTPPGFDAFRLKSLSFGSTGSTSSSSSTDSVSSSLGSSDGVGFDCDQAFATTPTVGGTFGFNAQDFTSVLLSPTGASNSQRVQQQNAYNTALTHFAINSLRSLNINELESVFETPAQQIPQQQQQQQHHQHQGSPPPPPLITTPPALMDPHPPSPVDSFASSTEQLEELGTCMHLCGSPPNAAVIVECNRIRGPSPPIVECGNGRIRGPSPPNIVECSRMNGASPPLSSDGLNGKPRLAIFSRLSTSD